MKLESQVCSLDLAKRLEELGVKQESMFFWNGKREYIRTGLGAHDGVNEAWRKDDKLTWEIGRIESEHPSCEESCAAFTVAELGEYLNTLRHGPLATEASAAARGGYLFDTDYWALRLIDLLENKLITV